MRGLDGRLRKPKKPVARFLGKGWGRAKQAKVQIKPRAGSSISPVSQVSQLQSKPTAKKCLSRLIGIKEPTIGLRVPKIVEAASYLSKSTWEIHASCLLCLNIKVYPSASRMA